MTTAERIRAANDILMRGAFRRYMREHELLMDAACAPVPAGAKERGWAALQSEIRAERCVSAYPQPVEGQIAGLDALPPEASLSLLSSSDRGADRVIGPVVGGSGRTLGEHS